MDCKDERVVASSMWPARNHKRHLAQARDMEKVHLRLDNIEHRLAQIVTTLERSCDQADRLQADEADNVLTDTVQELSTRIERIELLLLRTPLDDFSILDTHIAKLLPTMASRAPPAQPEVELSPVQHATSFAAPDILSKCLIFDMTTNDDVCESDIAPATSEVNEREVNLNDNKDSVLSEGGSAGPLPLVTASGYGRKTTGDWRYSDPEQTGLMNGIWEPVPMSGVVQTVLVAVNFDDCDASTEVLDENFEELDVDCPLDEFQHTPTSDWRTIPCQAWVSIHSRFHDRADKGLPTIEQITRLLEAANENFITSLREDLASR